MKLPMPSNLSTTAWRRYGLALALVCCSSGCHLDETNLPQSSAFEPQRHQGLWRSEGYGRWLQISDAGMMLYDHAAPACLRLPISDEELGAYLNQFSVIDDDTIAFAPSPDASRFVFTRMDHSAEAALDDCLTSENPDPRLNFEYFAAVMGEHYAFFDLYGVDWDARVRAQRAQVNENTEPAALFAIFSQMLNGLADGHLSLSAAIDGELRHFRPSHSRVLRPALDRAFAAQSAISDGRSFRRAWYKRYQQLIRDELLAGQDNEDFDGLILWGKIGDIGYINLLRMVGFSDSGLIADEVAGVTAAMEEILPQLMNSRRIIVDITANGGGEDEVSRRIASYFASQRVLVYSKQARGSALTPQQFYIEPAALNYRGPVTLVTSDHSVSAAEIFTLAMRELPNVTQVGDTTRGAHSDVLDKLLPNGWELGLSNEIFRDARGVVWEGQGLAPQQYRPIFAGADIETSHLQAIQALLGDLQ